jgi:arsenate reductase-like glutaredoxin family protein
MKLENHLRTDTKEKLNKVSKEKLSKHDMLELMGSNNRVLKRGKGGAYRNA